MTGDREEKKGRLPSRWRLAPLGALAAASAALALEILTRLQAGPAGTPFGLSGFADQLALACLALAVFLLAVTVLRTRRLASRLRFREAQREREVAKLREEAALVSAGTASDQFPLLTFALDAQGRFERFNPRWLESLGCAESGLRAIRNF